MRFESFVNSERCKTDFFLLTKHTSLRALLIQKDVKLGTIQLPEAGRLRALLIQKDVKLTDSEDGEKNGLRALLIQKDVKLYSPT